jgi:hypothetical protein
MSEKELKTGVSALEIREINREKKPIHFFLILFPVAWLLFQDEINCSFLFTGVYYLVHFCFYAPF